MTPLDVLKAARKRIEKPENWLQGEFAKKAGGYVCNSGDPDAVCWCLSGAINAADTALGGLDDVDWLYMQGVVYRACACSIVDYNDTHTHPEVLEVMDKAIALAEKEQIA